MKLFATVFAACFAAPCVCAQPTDPSLLQTLISEVHQLRVSIERSNVVLPKMQLAIARLQMQQDRVDRRERDLQVVRNQLAAESVGRDRMQAALRQFEEQSRQAQDPTAKKQFDDAAASARADIEQQTRREQEARIQESDTLAQLKLEQAKLQEIEQQLAALDKNIP